jgi:hypothetical protein
VDELALGTYIQDRVMATSPLELSASRFPEFRTCGTTRDTEITLQEKN